MRKQNRIMGVHADPPRLTPLAAVLIACALSIPFAILAALEFWVF